MNERTPSLELSEVSRRFSESERLLSEARERLRSIVESETRSQGLADSLSGSARAVAEFTSRAEAIVRETESAVQQARLVLEAGSEVISGNALNELSKHAVTIDERIVQLAALQSDLLDAVNADSEARRVADQNADEHLRALREEISDLRARAVGHRTILVIAAGVLLIIQAAVAVASVLT